MLTHTDPENTEESRCIHIAQKRKQPALREPNAPLETGATKEHALNSDKRDDEASDLGPASKKARRAEPDPSCFPEPSLGEEQEAPGLEELEVDSRKLILLEARITGVIPATPPRNSARHRTASVENGQPISRSPSPGLHGSPRILFAGDNASSWLRRKTEGTRLGGAENASDDEEVVKASQVSSDLIGESDAFWNQGTKRSFDVLVADTMDVSRVNGTGTSPNTSNPAHWEKPISRSDAGLSEKALSGPSHRDEPEGEPRSVVSFGGLTFDKGRHSDNEGCDGEDGGTKAAGSEKSKKKGPNFTDAEDEIIEKGYALYGDNWEEIIKWGKLDRAVRTPASIKGRWRRLQVRKKGNTSGPPSPSRTSAIDFVRDPAKNYHTSLSNHSTGSADGGSISSSKRPLREEFGGDRRPSTSAASAPPDGCSEVDRAEMAKTGGSACTTPRSAKKISHYFPPSNNSPQPGRPRPSRAVSDESLVSGQLGEGKVRNSIAKPASSSATEVLLEELRVRDARIAELERSKKLWEQEKQQLRDKLTEAEKKVQMLEEDRVEMEKRLEGASRQTEVTEKRFEQRLNRVRFGRAADGTSKIVSLTTLVQAREVLIDSLKAQAIQSKRRARERLSENSLRLATITFDRHGLDYHERWQEGYAFTELQEQIARINREKEEIEKKRKTLAKRMKLSKTMSTEEKPEQQPTPNRSENISSRQTGTTNGLGNLEAISPQEFHELDEISKLRSAALKKEESDLLAQLERLTVERDLHIRECRRIRDEDQSRFNSHMVLNDRYLLMAMIGKGGFSEVYKAFDLVEMRQVACKIHSLSDQWTDQRKKSYIKHSLREYRIHKELVHPRVVRLFDVFEYDYHSFCTILEYCEGRDLESYLQTVKSLPEREARCVVMQVFAALKYLNEKETPIIHFDLKPGNILYHNGEVKVTDFGLSKIVEQEDFASFNSPTGGIHTKELELTSQGAGTYWYLPPEVFEPRKSDPIKISSKVDVWSLGCIFYELLYGVKPFGNDKSQHTILKESTITHDAQHLAFPAKPVVSVETKEFIKKCLEYRKDRRPDVLTLIHISLLPFQAMQGRVAGKQKAVIMWFEKAAWSVDE
ncbi:hypothetical protein HK104_010107 [Borealophlyctis nickersoniae]|nr:hypothetical protein HK104_010107 [Borealophlyctis nickersoniae]